MKVLSNEINDLSKIDFFHNSAKMIIISVILVADFHDSVPNMYASGNITIGRKRI